MKSITHPAWIAFGLATVYSITLTGPIISPDHDLIYHLTGSAIAITLTVLCYLIVLWLVLTGVLQLARRRGAVRAIVWSGLLLVLPVVLFHAYIVFTDADVAVSTRRAVVQICFAVFLVASVLWRRTLRIIDAIRPVAAVMLGFIAFAGVVVTAQLLWNTFASRNLNPPPVLHASADPSAQSADPKAAPHRVIWLLLDELSYQQVFEQRYPGLSLPAFDRLAAQSTVFTHAVATGDHTSYVLPSLMTGLPGDAVRVSASGELLSLRDPAGPRWNRFDQHDTVFQDALNTGYSTAVAGWYNPYCRILPAVLDHCFWTYREDTPANFSPRRTVGENLMLPLRSLLRSAGRLLGLTSGNRTEEQRDLRQHTHDYTALATASDQFVADPSIGFLFLHLPVPHPYGFYDRRTGAFATHHTSYIDNLALADAYLAHLREQLEQQHAWDSTTLVVMGDHSWRTKNIWLHSEGWTAEDDAASHGGQFDARPAVIVKLPNQQTAARVDEPWQAVRTRSMLDALLQGRVKSAADLQAWALAGK